MITQYSIFYLFLKLTICGLSFYFSLLMQPKKRPIKKPSNGWLEGLGTNLNT
ncbi:hypothetical protein PUND_a1993 [Pseudoalteromonas undina]|nr:hypothetical protein PUND_a1993 [Pseudoalteromonas undina]